MFKYRYTGKNPVEVPRIGIVRPGYVVTSNTVIIHPLFERYFDPVKTEEPKVNVENKKKGKRRNK